MADLLGFAAPLQNSYGCIATVESLRPSNMARRSMFLTIEGAATYGVVLAALTPFVIVFLLSLSRTPKVRVEG